MRRETQLIVPRPAGAVVRVRNPISGEEPMVGERFCRGDWWQAAWSRAAELRRDWPSYVVEVSHLYD